MTRIKNSIPIRSEVMHNALRAETKFKQVWKSLSYREKAAYLKAHGFDPNPQRIAQFQGMPHLKVEEPPMFPSETNPQKIDQFMQEKKQDTMVNLVDILTRPALVDPLPTIPDVVEDDTLVENADLFKPVKSIKPHAQNVHKIIKATPTVVKEHTNKISENAKKAASEWHAKSPMEKASHVAQHLGKAVTNVIHHAKHHVKHEAQMYHGAGKALAHLATGKKWKDLDDHHKSHLKHAIVHAGITAGSVAMGDPSGGHAAHGIGQAVGQVLSHFGAEHAHHAVTLGAGNVALKSVKDAYKKAISGEENTIPEKELLANKIFRRIQFKYGKDFKPKFTMMIGEEYRNALKKDPTGQQALNYVKDLCERMDWKVETSNKKVSAFEVEKEAKRIIKLLIDADIPEEEWAEILHKIEQQTKKDLRK